MCEYNTQANFVVSMNIEIARATRRRAPTKCNIVAKYSDLCLYFISI